jgi:hypothetical protein
LIQKLYRHTKLDTRRVKDGIFVAPNGITRSTRKELYGALGLVQDWFKNHHTKVIVLEDKDIMEILDCKDLSETIDEKILEFYILLLKVE